MLSSWSPIEREERERDVNSPSYFYVSLSAAMIDKIVTRGCIIISLVDCILLILLEEFEIL
jgi:hypothetical protein